MLLLAWPIVLFLLVVFRFRRRFNAEFERQQQITWPSVPARFSTDRLELEIAPLTEAMPYSSWLAHGYEFYTHGDRFVGKQLLPEEQLLDKTAGTALNLELNTRKAELAVRYDPADPTRNFLAVGHSGLSWGKVIIYAFFGVVLPLLLTYSTLALLTDPGAWWDAITFGSPENLPIN
jgi:hypothetical protein